MKGSLLIIALMVDISQAWFWSKGWFWSKPEGTEWNGLEVTWPKYSSLPKTASEAQKNGWKKLSSCNDLSYFRGNRYVLKNDKSVMLLFDCNGKIAGIQFGIAKSLAVHPSFQKRHWNNDGDSLVVTAYFTHPLGICSGKRPETVYIGDHLYVQVGPTPNNLMSIPFKESDICTTKWVEGKCFYTMGKHYWYNISTSMKCEDFFPMFLLYNKDKLTGFGWAMQANVNSSRVEHPPSSKFHYFFNAKTQPKCLNSAGLITTQHISLTKHALLSFC